MASLSQLVLVTKRIRTLHQRDDPLLSGVVVQPKLHRMFVDGVQTIV